MSSAVRACLRPTTCCLRYYSRHQHHLLRLSAVNGPSRHCGFAQSPRPAFVRMSGWVRRSQWHIYGFLLKDLSRYVRRPEARDASLISLRVRLLHILHHHLSATSAESATPKGRDNDQQLRDWFPRHSLVSGKSNTLSQDRQGASKKIPG